VFLNGGDCGRGAEVQAHCTQKPCHDSDVSIVLNEGIPVKGHNRVARNRDANATAKAKVEAGRETNTAIVLDRGSSHVGGRITAYIQAVSRGVVVSVRAAARAAAEEKR
jgi:hypothetical protein